MGQSQLLGQSRLYQWVFHQAVESRRNRSRADPNVPLAVARVFMGRIPSTPFLRHTSPTSSSDHPCWSPGPRCPNELKSANWNLRYRGFFQLASSWVPRRFWWNAWQWFCLFSSLFWFASKQRCWRSRYSLWRQTVQGRWSLSIILKNLCEKIH